jgi:hypothetical protein
MPTVGKIKSSLDVKVGGNYSDHCDLTFQSVVITALHSPDADSAVKCAHLLNPLPSDPDMAVKVGKSMIS